MRKMGYASTAQANCVFFALCAWADCALACPLGYFASCGCGAFETAYNIYDKNILWMFLLYAKAHDG